MALYSSGLKILCRTFGITICVALIFFGRADLSAKTSWQISALIPNDENYSNQWYLSQINAPSAWEIITGSTEVVVAVIDTVIDISHPDLKENIWVNRAEVPFDGIDNDGNGYRDDYYGWNFTENSNIVYPQFDKPYSRAAINHGTIIAGIIGARGNNFEGVVGVNWQVKIMPLVVMDSQGYGSTENVRQAIDYAIDNGAHIINMSIVTEEYDEEFEKAVKRAYEAGVLIVAASGNDQVGKQGVNLDENPFYPTCFKGKAGENYVLGVAATDPLDQKADFSNYGSSCIGISAPGVDFFTTVVQQNHEKGFEKFYDGYWSGTSVAAPLVSGVAALAKALNPSLSSREIHRIITANSQNIDGINKEYQGMLGAGRLDAYKVAKAVSSFKPSGLASTGNFRLLASPQNNYLPQVNAFSYKGELGNSFLAYAKEFRPGVNAAVGDIDGNGLQEIVTGANSGGGPHVRVFDIYGNLKSQFFAYDRNFRGGVNVALGDVNGDSMLEIITAPASGGEPQIRIFNQWGELKSEFLAYDRNFRGGVKVASGDLNGDGWDEIITGPGKGGGPQVRVFDKQGGVKLQFFAYDQDFRGGISVAAGDINRNGFAEIITGPGKGGGPQVRVFDRSGSPVSQFFAYDRAFRGGVSVCVGDLDNNGVNDIATGAGEGGGPHIRLFNRYGEVFSQFFTLEQNYKGGLNVACW